VLEFDDIQGIVFSGYGKKPFASYLVLQVVDAVGARGYLGQLAGSLTSGRDRPAERCINLALTATGLRALGVDDDTLQTFPLEFREGLAGSDTRSRTLGDVGESDPSHWVWGGPSRRAHALLMLYARTEHLLRELVEQQHEAMRGAFTCLHTQSTLSLPDRREHFGFADGIAQPVIEGSERPSLLPFARVKAGEFILGYENEYGKLPFVPNAAPALDRGGHLSDCQTEGVRKALGRNGTYLVVRQLEQRVHAFWSYMREAAAEHGGDDESSAGAVRLAAKCVGRWPSGAPLVEAPEQDDPTLANHDAFGYFLRDRRGQRCPIGAHIRRANPRDSLEPDPIQSKRVVDRHRVMRRGRSYGKGIDLPWLCERDDGEERGLIFIAVNSNIRRQFEFIQQTWINNAKFAGLYDEVDPLIGEQNDEHASFSIPSEPVRQRLDGLPNFVRVRAGDYFFLPSLRAVRFLAALA
jgi:Dyp-type peroxidase family